MKKLNLTFLTPLLAIICICTVFFSCKKSHDIPKLIIDSVTYAGLDSVAVKGRITATGGGEIKSFGLLYSTDPGFNGAPQISFYTGQTSFSTIVKATHEQTYYFKAFASNSKGNGYSNVFNFVVPDPPPATAPCTLTTNHVMDNGGTFSVTVTGSSISSYGKYQVSFGAANETVYLYFPSAPHNGVYTTVQDQSNISEGQISISIITNFISSIVSGGQYVYVALDATNGTTTITFCPLNYDYGGIGIATISGKGIY